MEGGLAGRDLARPRDNLTRDDVSMTTALRERIGKVQSAAMRLRWTWAVGQFLAWELLVLLMLGLLDALVRFSTPVGRWLLTAAALAATARLMQRYLWPCFRFRPELVATARRIEAHYPHLAEQLSSAIAFLEMPEHDPAAGSLAMRQAVIATAEKLTAAIDPADVLDPRPARRALARALAVGLVCVGLAVWQPQAVRIALARLWLPFSDASWPRRHELVLVDPPRRVAAGSEVTLTLVDRKGTLPDRLELWIEPVQPAAAGAAAPASGQVRGVAGGVPRLALPLGSVHQSLRYRVRGGDDDTMGWQVLEVVPPPTVRQFRLRVEPPAYTGLPAWETGTSVQALALSELVLTAELDRPVARGQLRLGGAASPLPAESEEGGRRWTVGRSPPWLMQDEADTAELELFDADGTKFVPLRLHLTPIPDQPPNLVWSMPEEESVATLQAQLRVVAQVQDDFGVRQVLLHAACEEEGLEATWPLYLAAEPPGVRRRASQAAKDEPSPGGLTDAADLVAIDTAYALLRLPARPGQVWTLSLSADDFKPQTTRAPPRRVKIVTVAELKQLLASRQQAVLAQLAQTLRLARQIRDELGQAVARAESALAPEDALRLQAIQYSLAQVADALAAGPGGAEEKLAALLAELKANGLDDDEQGRPLARWLAAVQALNQQAIPAVEEQLAKAQEAAQAALASSSREEAQRRRGDVSAALSAAGQQQARLVQALEEMLDVAQRWNELARMAGQVSELEQLQRSLTGQIEQLQLQSLSAAADQAAALRASGRRLSQQQADLARRMDELHAAVEQWAADKMADDPNAAARIEAAQSALRRQAIGSTMRQGAMQLAQGQYDRATAQARQALESLRHLDAILQGTTLPASEPATAASWQQTLAALVAAQRELAAAIAQLDAAGGSGVARPSRPNSGELAAREHWVAQELEALRPQMPRLFQWVAEEAHRAMRLCEQLLSAGRTDAPAQHAAQNALALLQQLQQATAGQPQRQQGGNASSSPPSEPPASDNPLREELKLLLLWQEWIARQTAAMERQRPPDGSWTPDQRAAIEDLARQQQRLAQALQTLLETPPSANVAQP